ncbi:hypothetical protein [Marinifilum sp.]|uniref:hypothetical protein n=1 Tax=Marinifilum sp. TaxID=2033137 RepID=UPI003BAD30F5
MIRFLRHIALLFLFLSVLGLSTGLGQDQHVCIGESIDYKGYGWNSSLVKWYLDGVDSTPDQIDDLSTVPESTEHPGYHLSTYSVNWLASMQGDHTITLIETAGTCDSDPITIQVRVHNKPTAPTATVNPIACNGEKGKIITNYSSSVPAGLVLQFRLVNALDDSPVVGNDWTNASGTSHEFADLSAGDYKVQIRYTFSGNLVKGSVVSSTTYSLIEPAAITLTSAGVTTPITCNGGDATVTILATGGTAPLEYTFDGVSNTTGIFTHKAGTSLAYSVTDANSCTAVTGSIDISEPDLVIIALAETSSIVCNGDNAQVTITASGGDGSYSYSTDGTNYQAATNVYSLPAGSHTLYVKDGNGCVAQADIIISEPDAIATNLTIVTSDICFGDAGVITIENYEVDVTYSLFEGVNSLAYTSSVSGSDLILTIDNTVLNTEKTYNITIKAERGGCTLDMDTGVSINVKHKPNPGEINF